MSDLSHGSGIDGKSVPDGASVPSPRHHRDAVDLVNDQQSPRHQKEEENGTTSSPRHANKKFSAAQLVRIPSKIFNRVHRQSAQVLPRSSSLQVPSREHDYRITFSSPGTSIDRSPSSSPLRRFPLSERTHSESNLSSATFEHDFGLFDEVDSMVIPSEAVESLYTRKSRYNDAAQIWGLPRYPVGHDSSEHTQPVTVPHKSKLKRIRERLASRKGKKGTKSGVLSIFHRRQVTRSSNGKTPEGRKIDAEGLPDETQALVSQDGREIVISSNCELDEVVGHMGKQRVSVFLPYWPVYLSTLTTLRPVVKVLNSLSRELDDQKGDTFVADRIFLDVPASESVLHVMLWFSSLEEQSKEQPTVTLPEAYKVTAVECGEILKRMISLLPGAILGSVNLFKALADVSQSSVWATDPDEGVKLISLALLVIHNQWRFGLICGFFSVLKRISVEAEGFALTEVNSSDLPTIDTLPARIAPLLLGNRLKKATALFEAAREDISRIHTNPQSIRKSQVKSRMSKIMSFGRKTQKFDVKDDDTRIRQELGKWPANENREKLPINVEVYLKACDVVHMLLQHWEQIGLAVCKLGRMSSYRQPKEPRVSGSEMIFDIAATISVESIAEPSPTTNHAQESLTTESDNTKISPDESSGSETHIGHPSSETHSGISNSEPDIDGTETEEKEPGIFEQGSGVNHMSRGRSSSATSETRQEVPQSTPSDHSSVSSDLTIAAHEEVHEEHTPRSSSSKEEDSIHERSPSPTSSSLASVRSGASPSPSSWQIPNPTPRASVSSATRIPQPSGIPSTMRPRSANGPVASGSPTPARNRMSSGQLARLTTEGLSRNSEDEAAAGIATFAPGRQPSSHSGEHNPVSSLPSYGPASQQNSLLDSRLFRDRTAMILENLRLRNQNQALMTRLANADRNNEALRQRSAGSGQLAHELVRVNTVVEEARRRADFAEGRLRVGTAGSSGPGSGGHSLSRASSELSGRISAGFSEVVEPDSPGGSSGIMGRRFTLNDYGHPGSEPTVTDGVPFHANDGNDIVVMQGRSLSSKQTTRSTETDSSHGAIDVMKRPIKTITDRTNSMKGGGDIAANESPNTATLDDGERSVGTTVLGPSALANNEDMEALMLGASTPLYDEEKSC
ncbi:hypothetical protein MMC25_007677 [Agyrium rufum]|nr:hypothetical protein [Agyrium rufum]